MPHYARLAITTLGLVRLGAAVVIAYPSRGDHAFQEPTYVLAQGRIQTSMFVNVLQNHLFQQDIQHQDAAEKIVFCVGLELRKLRQLHVIVFRQRSFRGIAIIDHRC